MRGSPEGALLPPGIGPLLWLCLVELAVFGVLFGLVVWSGRLGADDLLLRPRSGSLRWAVPRSLAYSVGLRLAVGLFLGAALAAWQLARGAPIENLDDLRPKVEAMVEVSALRDPLYFGLMITLVSFGLAGLREELWRSGMVALLGRNWPRVFGGRMGPWLALVPTAVIFGAAHAAQGGLGIAATTLLGLGLGAVMLAHRSLWEAALAHGFFNAATFGLLLLLADRWPEVVGGG